MYACVREGYGRGAVWVWGPETEKGGEELLEHLGNLCIDKNLPGLPPQGCLAKI